MKRFVKILSKREFYTKNLEILNLFTVDKLTKKEVEFLVEFLILKPDLTSESMFNAVARKIVKSSLTPPNSKALSDASMSNYINALVKKKFLIKNPLTGFISINPKIVINTTEQYMIELIKEDENK